MGESKYILGIQSNDPFNNLIQRTLYRTRVTFEGSLAPAEVALVVGDLDEEPAGFDSEVLDCFDLGCH